MRTIVSRPTATILLVAAAVWAGATPAAAQGGTLAFAASPPDVRSPGPPGHTAQATPTAQASPAAPAPPASQAAQAGALRLTLPDVLERALAASHRIGEFEARQDAAKASVDARAANDMPTITALGGYARTNHVQEFAIQGAPGTAPRVIYPDVPDNWRARLDVQWPIYTFGRFEGLDRAARAEADAAGKDVATAKADTRLDATRAFWALVTATESVRVVEDAMTLVDAHLRDVRNMFASGLVAPNDVLSVEAQRSREQVLLIEARNNRNVAEADLRRLIGAGPEVSITLDAALEGPAGDVPAYDALLAEARAQRTDRQALVARIGGIGDRRSAVAAGLKPTLAVVGGVDYARPNPRIFPRSPDWQESWDVGFNVAWPLWDGGKVKADVAEISANQRAAQERLADLDAYLAFEVKQRRLDLEAAQAAIVAAADGVRAASEARRVVGERFKAGLVPNTEVLDAQQALLFAEFERTRTLAAARLAQARLDRAVGR